MVRLELGSIGIIEGESKRVLECYVDSRLFEQRKSYDEYFVNVSNVEVDLGVKDLMLLAEVLTVKVLSDCVSISN